MCRGVVKTERELMAGTGERRISGRESRGGDKVRRWTKMGRDAGQRVSNYYWA